VISQAITSNSKKKAKGKAKDAETDSSDKDVNGVRLRFCPNHSAVWPEGPGGPRAKVLVGSQPVGFRLSLLHDALSLSSWPNYSNHRNHHY
jgi:hypothetical protein